MSIQITKISYSSDLKQSSKSKREYCILNFKKYFSSLRSDNSKDSIEYSNLDSKQATPILKSVFFPQLNNISAEQINTIRQNLQTQGFDESITFSDEVLTELSQLVSSSNINKEYYIVEGIDIPKDSA